MFGELETLLALAEVETMTRAAQRLRISQSAVSKRIASLGAELGVELVVRHGRRVRLTPAATRLVERARPLLAELRGAVAGERAQSSISIGVSESILSSWGAAALQAASADGIELRVAAHRSPVVVEQVRAGETMLALCAGTISASPDLMAEQEWQEPLVLIAAGDPSTRLRVSRRRATPVMTIERGSATWRSLKGQLRALRRATGIHLEVTRQVQSFACIVQLARAGFGHGLVPVGVARALGVTTVKRLPAPGLARPVALIGRPSTLARPVVAAFASALCQHIDAAAESGWSSEPAQRYGDNAKVPTSSAASISHTL